ncbi:ABC transporter permease [Burkholderia vietnamiensis]|nr:ABC transporter permease [Burkholderia vietnamiensis]
MTTSSELRTLFVNALIGATDAGTSVYSPFDWPTAGDAYPAILVHARRERKESLGPNVPEFNVFTTIDITARTKSPARVGDLGAADALMAAERLKAQIEVALINNPAIWADPNGGQRIEQFTSVESDLMSNSEGSMPMAELSMQIEVKFYQGPEDFFPIPLTPLTEMTLTVEEPDGTVQPGFEIALPQ